MPEDVAADAPDEVQGSCDSEEQLEEFIAEVEEAEEFWRKASRLHVAKLRLAAGPR